MSTQQNTNCAMLVYPNTGVLVSRRQPLISDLPSNRVDNQSVSWCSSCSMFKDKKISHWFLYHAQWQFTKLPIKTTTGVPVQSSSEAEYLTLSDADALNEVVWIVMLLRIEVITPIEFKEDNEATIKFGQNKMASARSKYIDLRHHIIRYHNDKDTRYDMFIILINIWNNCKYIDKVFTTVSIRKVEITSHDWRRQRYQRW